MISLKSIYSEKMSPWRHSFDKYTTQPDQINSNESTFKSGIHMDIILLSSD